MVIKVIQLFLLIALLLLQVGCSSSARREERAAYRNVIAAGNYSKGLQELKKLDIYKDKNSKLLALMEEGLVNHYLGNYYQSLLHLEKAKKLSQKYFTKSVKGKIASVIINDNEDIYYGAHFERSFIHLYLALNHYMIYQNGMREAHLPVLSKKEIDAGAKIAVVPEQKLDDSERRQELFAARAEILAWDSLLKDFQNDRKGKTVFKDDIMAKVFGGFIHEATNSRGDRQIALQLYKDAKNLLVKNYGAYRTFNHYFQRYKKDFERFPKLGLGVVKKEYFSQTNYATKLEQFLNYKILKLTKRIRGKSFKRTANKIEAVEETIKRVKKEKKENNVHVFLQVGTIPEKIADKYSIGLEGAMNQAGDNQAAQAAVGIGHAALTLFAANELGLYPQANQAYTPGHELGIQLTALAVGTTAITFELPKVRNLLSHEKVEIVVHDKQGKEVASREVTLLSPLGDIAEEAVAEDSAARYVRTGVRVAMKHVAAIAAAYGTYAALAGSEKTRIWAKTAAVLEYMAASKIIESSEQADIRYWSTLPKDFRMAELHLPKGDYTLKARVHRLDFNGNIQSSSEHDLGSLTVENPKLKKLINKRILL